jgi:hypothetical protein
MGVQVVNVKEKDSQELVGKEKEVKVKLMELVDQESLGKCGRIL